MKEIEITELLLTKFSHDMAGVIGAINNGLEISEEPDENLRKQALDLLNFSAQEALSRLQFFRLIYGIAEDSGKMDLAEFQELLRNFFKNSKTILEYANTENEDFARERGKLLGNLIYAASQCLPRGGKLIINMKKFSINGEVMISAENDHIKLEEPMLNALAAKKIVLRESEIQPYYTALLAEKLGFVITIKKSDGHLEVVLIAK